MKKDLLISAVVGAVIVLVVGGILLSTGVVPKIAGDFAGGVQPTQVLNCSAATQSCTPVSGLPNFLVNGAVSAGGTAAANQITGVYTGVAVWPTASTTIATSSFTAAATSTTVSFTAPGFVIGDECPLVQISGTTSTLFTTAFVTAVSGNAVTTTVSFINATAAAVPVTVTSTVTGVSSTLKTTCFATGV